MNLITELLEKEKVLHFTLIDPEEQSPLEAGRRAKTCQDYGTNAIMVGGSTVRETKKVDDTVKEIKNNVDLPVILFPNSTKAISQFADYIFFMSLLNSKEYQYVLGEQLKGTPLVEKFNLEPISMAYLVISMSEKPTQVEKAANLDTVQREDIEKAVNYSLLAKNLSMECIYLEAGSGAEFPVSNEMISGVRKAVDLPIIVGGGINDGKTAREKVDSGADVIVNGTLGEKNCSKIKEIIEEIKI